MPFQTSLSPLRSLTGLWHFAAPLAAALAAACSTPPYAPSARDAGPRDAQSVMPIDGDVPDTASSDSGVDDDDVFDPGAVYLRGTFQQGACYRDAIEDFDPTTGALAGFPCSRFDTWVRPSDGRIIYLLSTSEQASIRVFSADPWHRTREGYVDYTNVPEQNDARVPTPECATVHSFRVEPGTGDVVYRCRNCAPGVACDGKWYRTGGDEYRAPTLLDELWLGYDGIALIEHRSGSGAPVAIWRDGEQVAAVHTDLSDFDEGSEDILWARAEVGGFLVLTKEGERHTLFSVAAADGTVELLGSYPLPGDDLTAPISCMVDANRQLYCESRRRESPFDDLVLRSTLGAEHVEIVHDEGDEPDVLLHGAHHLFTGP